VIDARFFRCAPLSPLPFQVMLNGIFIACLDGAGRGHQGMAGLSQATPCF
jgi:hypothetical protein